MTPAIKTNTAIIIDVKYSILPCPYGCFLSGAFSESFVPTIVIIEDSASLKLFTASKIMAIEFTKKPTVALNATKMRQNPNIQTYTIDGEKVKLTAREARTMRKASKKTESKEA